ncbi:MAG: hypothetical protein F6K17_16145, partial [Okeania sp. SIO3C4]|nr:hypothetical protein [Okeania sp. SIO3C4]
MQHVYKSDDDDSLFHAVFTTGRSGLTGSAICTFRLADV